VPIVAEVGRWFVKGEPVGQQRLAEELGLPVRSVAELSTKLEEAGLIHRVQARNDGESGFTLAMPPDRLQVRRVLDVAHGLTPRLNRKANQPGWAYLDRLQASLDATAGDQTLAEILDRYDREVEEAEAVGDAAAEDDEGNGSLRVSAKANEPAA
jgi:DNA-binding IscR family transcriptional regulator